MMDFTARMSGCTIFGKIDLGKGCNQIPMHAKDICIITPFGLSEFLHMGFGLCNAGKTFQCMMDSIAISMTIIFIYLDDIIVGSWDIQSHIQHLHLLFEGLQDYGLVINGEKCEFRMQELDFLGYRVSDDGVAPPEESGRHPGPPTPR
jgi:hypothetical protein